MQKARQISLYLAIAFWAMIVGGVVYSHIVYFPPYLGNLPESNQLITGAYGLHDEDFWMRIHPIVIVLTITTLILNWKLKQRRKYIGIAAVIYAFAIFFTAIYFVPELMAFAKSTTGSASKAELFARGQDWQHRSWIRGAFIFVGFILLLVALEKDKRVATN